jgi:ribosomal protein S2
MKIKQNLNQFKKIFEIHLIKLKSYEKTIKKNNFSLQKTIIEFKKSLNIIFKYHRKNNQILFLGLPDNINFKLNKTKHIIIPITSNLRKTNYFTKIKKKPDLIVVFCKNDLNYELFLQKEFFHDIPIVEFSNIDKMNKLSNICYKIPCNINSNKNSNNLFFSIIHNLLKINSINL